MVPASATANRAERKADPPARRLRPLPVPVRGRVQDNAPWMDLRCLRNEGALPAQLLPVEQEDRT